MDKKEFKLYVTPGQEIIDLELEGHLLSVSDPEGAELPKYEEQPMD